MPIYKGYDIQTQPEPMGSGWEAWLRRSPDIWERADTKSEAIDYLVKRLHAERAGDD